MLCKWLNIINTSYYPVQRLPPPSSVISPFISSQLGRNFKLRLWLLNPLSSNISCLWMVFRHLLLKKKKRERPVSKPRLTFFPHNFKREDEQEEEFKSGERNGRMKGRQETERMNHAAMTNVLHNSVWEFFPACQRVPTKCFVRLPLSPPRHPALQTH